MALYANRDRIAEFLEQEWEKLAHERLSMACNIQDGQFSDDLKEKEATFSEGEATTPDATDAEWIDSDSDNSLEPESLEKKLHGLDQSFELASSDASSEGHMDILLSSSEYEEVNSDVDGWGASTANAGESGILLKHRKKLPADDMSLYESTTDIEPWEDSLD